MMRFRPIIMSVLSLGLLSVGGLACIGGAATSAPPAAPVSGQQTSIMVLPFQMNGDNSGYGWIGQAVQQSVAGDISRNPALQAVTTSNAPATADMEAATSAAREASTPLVVFGNYQVSGDDVIITANLADVASQRMLTSVSANGAIHTLFAMENQLDRQLDVAIENQMAAVANAAAISPPMTAAQPYYDTGTAPDVLSPADSYDQQGNYQYYPEYPSNPPMYFSYGYPGFFGGDFVNNDFRNHRGMDHDRRVDHPHFVNPGTPRAAGHSVQHSDGGARIHSAPATPRVSHPSSAGGRSSGGRR